jgi:anti-sigma factor RsiW
MMSHAEELAARAAAAASASSHEHPNSASPHPTLDEVSNALLGLPDEDRAAGVLEHAEDCDECSAHVAELESVIELARFAYPDQMPSGAEARLKAILAAEAASRTAGSGSGVVTRSASAGLVLPDPQPDLAGRPD